YAFSSVIFYAEAYHNDRVLLLNGRVNNLEYGSNAPDAPQDVFIDDEGLKQRWLMPDRYYICIEKPQVERIAKLVGQDRLHTLIESGGKFVLSNQ
ncbi:MAG: glycosyltransferase family 39 protein, partial [Bryobacteraceae bacterium]